MRTIALDQNWTFDLGAFNIALGHSPAAKTVNLPHDYMIESDTYPEAVTKMSGGYYTAGVAHYEKMIFIPKEWEGEVVSLVFDGAMMNTTVEVNGCKATLHHYGYTPFCVDLTPFVYYGEDNRLLITVNPSMQPNSRWYSGAGLFRGVKLVHTPKLHIANDGIFAYTQSIEDNIATVKTQIEIVNKTLMTRIAEVKVSLLSEEDECIVSRHARIQLLPDSTDTAYMTLTVAEPKLWDIDHPDLYKVRAEVQDVGEFRTHFIEEKDGTVDTDEVLFGIRTVTADVTHGLRINGKEVKLKGGCLHHDNGILGAVSLYDAEYRKLSILKKIGFNAVRTTHNPPSAAFLEACDRIGMYVFAEAFDAWGMAKQPGDYNQFFDTDWKDDLTAFIRRDRSHPSVIIWSTGNEVMERGGLNKGYTLATRLAEATKALDPTRPVANGICSFWSGLDDLNRKIMDSKLASTGQNADTAVDDLTWEEYTESFTNGLDIVGYNYQEGRYLRDHEMYPERIILGSENFPNQIGFRWPLVEAHPWILGDFTWTAFDYIGEAGIGKSVHFEPDDPRIANPRAAVNSHFSEYPWRLANDADVDITGHILPQGDYRSVVWGNDATFVYSYDPDYFGKVEIVTPWGFTDVRRTWNWPGKEGKPVNIAVFSKAEEVEVLVNGKSVGRQKAGEHIVGEMPRTFVFPAVYKPGKVEAVSFEGGKEVSRASLETTGAASAIRLNAERTELPADGHSAGYVSVEILDEKGRVVPEAEVKLTARIEGDADHVLAGFGSGNPITAENYTRGSFSTYRGRAMAIIRSGYKAGTAKLIVEAEGLQPESIQIKFK